MDELGLDIGQVLPWFEEEQNSPYILIQVPSEMSEQDIEGLQDILIDEDDY